MPINKYSKRVPIDVGLENLKTLIETISKSKHTWNEAETRFFFIDKFIRDCLGWYEEEFSLENSHRREYTDYELGKPRVVIWEAKKEGIYFEFPANPDRNLVTSLKSIMSLNASCKEAIEQAQTYCSSRGVQYAVVCNGHQFIVFLATRQDGISPFDSRCIAVDGYDQLISEFAKIWQYLSPAGVYEQRLTYVLKNGADAGIPRKLSSYLISYPQFRYKSEVQANLRTVAELLLEDTLNTPQVEPRFYRECYCESGALSQDALISKQILAARYALLFDPTKESPALESIKPDAKHSDDLSNEVVAAALARRPLVLIGDVGVGKSSFIKHLMHVRAESEFENSIFIYLDLGSKSALSSTLAEFTIAEVEKQLLERYQVDIREKNFVTGTYDPEIKRFKKGIWGDLEAANKLEFDSKLRSYLGELTQDLSRHLQRSIQHISKARKKQVIIVIDNADQRTLDVQQEAFVVAQNFSQNWDATVFIALRPHTFYQSKQAGALSAYPQKLFTISPPRADLVLEKRLVFALNMAEGKLPVEKLTEVSLNLKNISLFIKALLNSLRRNPEIIELLANISGGNVRTVIELITKFIGSPNVEAEKIIQMMQPDEDYKVPLHEFSKSALLGEYSHYSPESSIAMNVYDVRFPDPKEHFLLCMVLSFLNYDGPHRNREGFVTSEKLIEEMQNQAGFNKEQIENALRRATNKKLLETTERITFDEDITGLIGDMPSAFRITTAGAYHLIKWCSTFAYFDAMVFDTPIFDNEVARKLQRNPGSFDIAERLERASTFREYLSKQWQAANISIPYLDWPSLLPSGQSSFESVSRFVSKRAHQRAG